MGLAWCLRMHKSRVLLTSIALAVLVPFASAEARPSPREVVQRWQQKRKALHEYGAFLRSDPELGRVAKMNNAASSFRGLQGTTLGLAAADLLGIVMQNHSSSISSWALASTLGTAAALLPLIASQQKRDRMNTLQHIDDTNPSKLPSRDVLKQWHAAGILFDLPWSARP